jgi:hypothetical protein
MQSVDDNGRRGRTARTSVDLVWRFQAAIRVFNADFHAAK